MPKLIDSRQIRRLRTAASKRWGACTCDAETGEVCSYHEWLRDVFGVASTKALTSEQAERAIGALSPRTYVGKDGKRKTAKKRPPQPWKGRYVGKGKKGDHGWLTQGQADEIARLEHVLGWDEPERVEGFIHKQTRMKKSVSMLSVREATKVITGLRRLLDHQKASA